MTDLLDGHTTNLLFLAFGAFGLWGGWRDLGLARASRTWPRTTGHVVASGMRTEDFHDDGEPMKRAAITYHYEVAGAPYRGSRVFFGDDVALRFGGPARQRLAAYPAGRLVLVAYDPEHPRRAVLEPGATGATCLACGVSAAILLLGLIGLFAGA